MTLHNKGGIVKLKRRKS